MTEKGRCRPGDESRDDEDVVVNSFVGVMQRVGRCVEDLHVGKGASWFEILLVIA